MEAHPQSGLAMEKPRRVDRSLEYGNELVSEVISSGVTYVTKSEKATPQTPTPLEGVNHSLPEDVGGIWGYEDFLEAIGDPKHLMHDEYLEWIGGPFDPAAFDLEEVNEALRALG